MYKRRSLPFSVDASDALTAVGQETRRSRADGSSSVGVVVIGAGLSGLLSHSLRGTDFELKLQCFSCTQLLQTGHVRGPGLALEAAAAPVFAWLKRVQRSVPDDVPGLLCNWTGSRTSELGRSSAVCQ